jgi:hypothetical protein
MHVQMIDLLPAISVAVDDEPIAILSDSFLPGQPRGHQQHPSGQLFIIFRQVVGGRDFFVCEYFIVLLC